MKDDASRMELLKQITATEFMKDDLGLFLNTHPMEREVISQYNYYVMESRRLRENYEMNYGMLSEHDSLSPCPWKWIDEPWPWDAEANFTLGKEEM
jgi:spore coat protein JB